MIREYLKSKLNENGKIISPLLIVLWIVLAFLLSGYETTGIALLIAGIIWSSFEIALFHKTNGIDEVLSGCGFYQQKKQYLLIQGTLICSAPFAFAVCLFLLVFCKGDLWMLTFYSLVVYLFANSLGLALSGIPNQVLAYGVCFLVSVINFPKLLFLEQSLRHISPVVPVGNLEMFQWWNVFTILVIACTIYAWMIWKKKFIFSIALLTIGIIFVMDISISKKDTAVSESYEHKILDTVDYVNTYQKSFGLEGFDTVEIRKSVYYPWMSNEAKVPVRVENQKLFVNCFTPSLCNLSEEDIISRIIRSQLKPQYGAQNVMVSMYMSWVLGDRERVETYLRSENAFDALVSDVIVRHPEQFGALYALSEQWNTKEEIIEAWEKRDL